MFDTDGEIVPEGYCQMSCERCNCCISPAEAVARRGGSRFLQAAASTSPPLTQLLENPGFAATILVPTDQAWTEAEARYGAALRNKDVLLQARRCCVISSFFFFLLRNSA